MNSYLRQKQSGARQSATSFARSRTTLLFVGLTLLLGSVSQAQQFDSTQQPPPALPNTDARKLPSTTPAPGGEIRSARRIDPNGAKPKSIRGNTYVALASGLERIFEGSDPSSIYELKLLEAQQSRVAEQIEAVTVNVQQGAAQGSGVIITANGFVLTAAHVAGGAGREATLIMSDGRRVRARTLGLNKYKDAGLMQIEPGQAEEWPYATLARSGSMNVGQWVVAVGHPGGWNRERGSVIRVGRILKVKSDAKSGTPNTIFTDCALIGGDSGGPLFTIKGELIGIHSRIGTKVEENMHVPIDVFDESWDRMVNSEVWGVLPGYAPWLGVRGSSNNDRPVIEAVTRGGPAHKAGLEPGDLIVAFDGTRITTFAELKMGVEARMPGDTVLLTIQRDSESLRIPVIIGHLDQSQQ